MGLLLSDGIIDNESDSSDEESKTQGRKEEDKTQKLKNLAVPLMIDHTSHTC